jgi:flagellar biosynthesis/type III secretory pathway chaperone
MPNANPADALEAILIAENQALERHDADAAAALLEQKLAAANALSTATVSPEQIARLRDLAAQNRRLLERAIDVQSRIITMVAQAVQESTTHSRYGAAGRTIRAEAGLAIARQA